MKNGFAVYYLPKNSAIEAKAANVQALLMNNIFDTAYTTNKRKFISEGGFNSKLNQGADEQLCKELYKEMNDMTNTMLSEKLLPYFIKKGLLSAEAGKQQYVEAKFLFNDRTMSRFDEQKIHVDWHNPHLIEK